MLWMSQNEGVKSMIDEKHKLYNLSGRTGSLMYMAPEVLRSERYNEKARE